MSGELDPRLKAELENRLREEAWDAFSAAFRLKPCGRFVP